MGRKQNKKVVPSKSKESETSNTPTMQELDDCRKENRIIRNGDHKKELKIMEEAHRNNEKLGFLHRVHAAICTLAAFDNKDPRISKNHMDKAIELGQKAVLLSPKSIGFADFYTRLLFHNSHYQRVVQEGQRALAIENPIDPATEEWMESDGNPDLQLLQGYKNLNLLATTAKQTREDKLERVLEDQNGESKEIKQTKQNPEERKKEIEERLLAARLEQAIQEDYIVRPQSQLDYIAVLKEEKKKLEEQLRDASLLKERLQQFALIEFLWKSMPLAEKQKLNIDDLLAHFLSINTCLAMKVITDALGFVKDHQSWKFWMCWSCGNKFADSNLYFDHFLDKHVKSLSSEPSSVFPSKINKNWHDNICNGKWEPLDALAALPILEEHSEQLPSIATGCFTTESKMLNEKDNHTEKSSQKSTLKTKEGKLRPLEKESKVEAHSDSSMEIAVDDFELGEHEIKQLPKDDNSKTTSSLHEVYDRALLLESICQMLQKLLKEGCLVGQKSTLRTKEGKLRALEKDDFKLSEHEIKQLPKDLELSEYLCICYLGASQVLVSSIEARMAALDAEIEEYDRELVELDNQLKDISPEIAAQIQELEASILSANALEINVGSLYEILNTLDTCYHVVRILFFDPVSVSYIVQYTYELEENGEKWISFQTGVSAASLRPLPPPLPLVFELGDMIEILNNGGFWPGTVKEVENNTYKVTVFINGYTDWYSASDVRRSQFYETGQWLQRGSI